MGGCITFLERGNKIMTKNKGLKTPKIFVAILIVIMITTGSSCFTIYDLPFMVSPYDDRNNHPELFSIAINSVLGTRGRGGNGADRLQITVIEEDNFGRKMFLYFEMKVISRYSLHISQTSDDQYVYFYPDFNFISGPTDEFSIEEIEELKRKNDWNMEIDLSKSVKVEIVREKGKGPLTQTQMSSLYNKVFLGEDNYNFPSSYIFLTTDDYGRSIYLGIGRPSIGRYVVMLFGPDSSYDENKSYFELTDLFSYQEELKQFKELNNWNQPLN